MDVRTGHHTKDKRGVSPALIMERIKSLIADRPVAILLHGLSVKSILDNKERFLAKGYVLISTNAFRIIEDNILSPLDRELDIVAIFYEAEWGIRMGDTIKFLSRDRSNLVITTRREQSIMDCSDRLADYTSKIVLVADAHPMLNSMPNSMTLLVQRLIGAGCRSITLFGADGCSIATPLDDQYDTYLGGEQLKTEARATGIRGDTVFMNCYFQVYVKQAKELYGITDEISILNCSPSTYLTCIKKIGYKDLQDEL